MHMQIHHGENVCTIKHLEPYREISLSSPNQGRLTYTPNQRGNVWFVRWAGIHLGSVWRLSPEQFAARPKGSRQTSTYKSLKEAARYLYTHKGI